MIDSSSLTSEKPDSNLPTVEFLAPVFSFPFFLCAQYRSFWAGLAVGGLGFGAGVGERACWREARGKTGRVNKEGKGKDGSEGT